MADELRRDAERAAAAGDPEAAARVAAWEARTSPPQQRRERCAWAKGPAHVPPEKDFPPVGWGWRWTWEERLAKWRARPAKERRACNAHRVTRSPSMPLVVVYEAHGWDATITVRWSEGGGFWPGAEKHAHPSPCRRGFWRSGAWGDASEPIFLGETIEGVRALIEKERDTRLGRINHLADAALLRVSQWKEPS